jgi:hypothetical protein
VAAPVAAPPVVRRVRACRTRDASTTAAAPSNFQVIFASS